MGTSLSPGGLLGLSRAEVGPPAGSRAASVTCADSLGPGSWHCAAPGE